jgi:hypothetical protein
MKKLLMSIVLIAALSSNAFAAGAWTQNLEWITTPEKKTEMAMLTFTWTTTSQGVVTAVVGSNIKDSIRGSFLVTVVNKPTNLTTPYNFKLLDNYGLDILGGAGLAGVITGAQITPLIGLSYGPRPIGNSFTFTISSGGNTKSGTSVLYFSR